jgi:superfamily II DNA helicase RecQ
VKFAFRIECPVCKWGHEFRDSYVNMGFLKGKCSHCESDFFFKITVTGVAVETLKELPPDVPR